MHHTWEGESQLMKSNVSKAVLRAYVTQHHGAPPDRAQQTTPDSPSIYLKSERALRVQVIGCRIYGIDYEAGRCSALVTGQGQSI